ncbi:titin-like [Platysternon megacephalum]|uniref:Titin-like n=1 Tax=Platysternon megacephalum TaxID=55544 RepID=A0A4D9F657_9SAUR|nr:titin-like [Platysternon megacephalum]
MGRTGGLLVGEGPASVGLRVGGGPSPGLVRDLPRAAGGGVPPPGSVRRAEPVPGSSPASPAAPHSAGAASSQQQIPHEPGVPSLPTRILPGRAPRTYQHRPQQSGPVGSGEGLSRLRAESAAADAQAAPLPRPERMKTNSGDGGGCGEGEPGALGDQDTPQPGARTPGTPGPGQWGLRALRSPRPSGVWSPAAGPEFPWARLGPRAGDPSLGGYRPTGTGAKRLRHPLSRRELGPRAPRIEPLPGPGTEAGSAHWQ